LKHKEKGLSAGRLTMLALGSVIGGSFFLGSAVAIHAAGPSVLVGFILGGVLVYFILYALSEMTVSNPDSGSFRTFAASAFGEGAGFVVGWVYWTGIALAMSSESIAISVLVRAWFPSVSIPLLGSLIILSVTGLNLLGANLLSRLTNGLSAIKLLAILLFIIFAALLILGLIPGKPAVGIGALAEEPFMPNGIGGLAGSMLIVMFTYAGFEIIGLASSESESPKTTIPKAIRYTIISLIGLYLIYTALLLPLIPTAALGENISPIVVALTGYDMNWAGAGINLVMISAVFSTMLASMFGLGRMLRSLADEGLTPRWLAERSDIPSRSILFSGLFMLFALGVGLLLPQVYLFLISSAGFSILFSYIVIVASHIRFRKRHGCPDGKCQLWGYPYTSAFVLLFLIAALASMPFVKGQSSGLIAGIIIFAFYSVSYAFLRKRWHTRHFRQPSGISAEFSDELTSPKRNPPK
jgi:L-asparagine transporter-like permease